VNIQTGGIYEFGIAIVGMSGRWPGAANCAQFWENLRGGVESISRWSDEELRSAGVSARTIAQQNYVKAGAFLDKSDQFDAGYFNYSPAEAQFLDPQHRVFLECAVEALEDAGCDPHRYPGSIGVFAGASISTYELQLAFTHRNEIEDSPTLKSMIILGTDKDYLSSRVSYKLNLRGPSVTVQTACSTSLVAIHMACQSLLSNESDMALAGGSSIVNGPAKAGYTYVEGGIASPDGHCRPFDAKAAGTIFGDGVGVVVLKRLKEAIADRNRIYAIIRGSAMNNDGADKVSFTAPSVHGQAAVISEALSVADVAPQTIQYVEAHGTGTALGDPIEVGALQQVFQQRGLQAGTCLIGSLKANVGHLNTAAGVAGLIKTALALHHKWLPPSINFSEPNPQIDFESSPFRVNATGRAWQSDGAPRRAAVSSFGMGGTNAHVVLEEAPLLPLSDGGSDWHLLPLSAKTPEALDSLESNLLEHLQRHGDLKLADAAFTLSTGRSFLPYRRAIVCRDTRQVVERDTTISPDRISGEVGAYRNSTVFMFPGQGAQYLNMGRGLYEAFDLFRREFDNCSDLAGSWLGRDLRELVFRTSDDAEAAAALDNTEFAQPAMFAISYATARLWESWGVRPSAMIGHSIGEFVAACLAGVFSLDDALKLVVCRGKLMQALPAGSMLAVPLGVDEIRSHLNAGLSVAAENGPGLTVVSGAEGPIGELETYLQGRGVEATRLRTSHAFHSSMMEAALEPFAKMVESVRRAAPQIPYISNVTGSWITPAQATDPAYWARHLRESVKFWPGVQTLINGAGGIFVEAGPGRTLGNIIKHGTTGRDVLPVPSIRTRHDNKSDQQFILSAVASMWTAGADIDWSAMFSTQSRRRVSLPTYPFQRQRYWIEPRAGRAARASSGAQETSFHVPYWTRSPQRGASTLAAPGNKTVLLFTTPDDSCLRLSEHLRQQGHRIIRVECRESFAKVDDDQYRLCPRRASEFTQLVKDLKRAGGLPSVIIYCWAMLAAADSHHAVEEARAALDFCLFGPLYLGRALGEAEVEKSIDLVFVTTGARDVIGGDLIRPIDATVYGPSRVISLEYPNLVCRHVDIVGNAGDVSGQFAECILAELSWPVTHFAVAYRHGRRWVPGLAQRNLDVTRDRRELREQGVYLITGGLGALGLQAAKVLFEKCRAKLVLIGRSGLPDREEWDRLIKDDVERGRDVGRMLAVRALEAQGAELMIIKADVTDEVQMTQAIEQACARFGTINGVIHAAGAVELDTIYAKTADEIASVFGPKVFGAIVLEKVLTAQPVDFLMYFSSIAALEGGVGLVSYTAANAFLDAHSIVAGWRPGRATLSVNWDGWAEIGMAFETASVSHDGLAELSSYGLKTVQGAEALSRLLDYQPAQIVVSNRAVAGAFERQDAPKTENPKETKERFSTVLTSGRVYPRPAMSVPYVAPSSEIEKAIVEVWQEYLRIDPIGVNDDFFELGGHSLLALQMLPRVRTRFQIELLARDMWTAPTIASLAMVVEDKILNEIEMEELEDGETDQPADHATSRAQVLVGTE